MKIQSSAARIWLAFIALLFLAGAARAQSVSYIGGTGVDSNPCTRTQPCRSMQRGVDATPTGGTLQILDSAGYGPNVTINKSITISARDINASIMTPSGIAILVNAPGATVVLRGLTLNGIGSGTNGISVISAASVHVEDCSIERFTNNGISHQADGELFVRDATSRNNGSNGLEIAATTGTARVTISKSRFEANGGDGIDFASGTIQAVVVESSAARNAANGFGAGGAPEAGILIRVHFENCVAANNNADGFTSLATAEVTIERSTARGNGASGMTTGGTGSMVVSNSVAAYNGTGFNSAGGLFESRQNNNVTENTVNVSGAITPLSAM